MFEKVEEILSILNGKFRGNIKHIQWKVGRHLKIQIKFLGMKITMCKMDEINELGFPKLCDIAIETLQSEKESRK